MDAATLAAALLALPTNMLVKTDRGLSLDILYINRTANQANLGSSQEVPEVISPDWEMHDLRFRSKS